ncbi:PREDICTED: dehydrodolichyl diphosphate synthase complex subunit DHDDS-like [Nicrophorus vespilloides]|uniref:ditrans,polycis-polyprenyl diphosphate synthase [(2E,6E)-farnesyldiphosphate specific] n=1 Tax=Nicrophorus vespilloides TaxID=110193 RepID=A0ABM1M743_NICVS|nr:PREDICTED: dehydrodolichyl diphosphate synthase complex subunit DHDDS-like [Nicrophorus vespilloides]
MDLKIIPLMQKLCLDVIKIGRIPNHMALILDGNRRFAARFNEGSLFGNTIGFDRLFEVIKITRYLGVRYCTIYIFSIENFKRSKDEVQSLFDLIEEKIIYFLENINKLKKMGNHSLVPKKLYSMMSKLYLETRMGTDYYLNIAFAYTSRDEIAYSINTIANGLKTKDLTELDVDESLLNACTYLGDLPKVDLLIRTSEPSWLQKFYMNVLNNGRIPNHLAIILDGNRRYATRMNKETQFGHRAGFDRITEIFNFTRYTAVRYCTIYIFSIENFKRSPDEVKILMELAEEKFDEFLMNIDEFRNLGICVKFFGNPSMVPKNLYSTMCKIQMETKMETKYFLNFAFAYTSRDEITHSISTICKGLKSEVITESDVDESLLNDCTYLGDLPKVDLLLRTSGVVRLSDFLLLQIADAQIIFMDCTWPEFSFLKCLYCLIQYQRCQHLVEKSNHHQSTKASMEFRKKCNDDIWKNIKHSSKAIID